eukprot:scaffold20424_cov22-Tisochrysis_lutea.AAC.2
MMWYLACGLPLCTLISSSLSLLSLPVGIFHGQAGAGRLPAAHAPAQGGGGAACELSDLRSESGHPAGACHGRMPCMHQQVCLWASAQLTNCTYRGYKPLAGKGYSPGPCS